MYYLQSRYYDPAIGRFINADGLASTGQGFIGCNMFAYCLNDPINLTDNDGQFAFFAATAIFGATLGAIIGGVRAAKKGERIWRGIAKGALIGGAIGAGVGALAGITLAGSATATIASVGIGANALVTTLGSVGFVGGMKMAADNFSQALSRAPQVFWSGGEIVKNTARDFANMIGGKTLEMTRLGTYLESIEAASPTWRAASANFANVANNASRTIYCIQNSAGIRIQSIWATIEYGIVSAREIFYGIVS